MKLATDIARCVVAMLLALVSSIAIAGSATLTWSAPPLNEDGLPYTNPSHYAIHVGCVASGAYEEQTINNIPHTLSSLTVTALPEGGLCYFVATATNTLGETSAYSGEYTEFIQDPPGTTTIDISWQESAEAPMTTFSLANSQNSSFADPASITTSFTPTEGNLLLILLTERSGGGSAPHVVTDDNANSWAALIRHDQEITDPNARHSFSLWAHVVNATDAEGTIVITGDDGTGNNKEMSVFEIAPSAAYDFTFQTQSSGDTGTGSTSPVSTGVAAAPGAADAFVFGVGSWRRSSTISTFAFTNLNSSVTNFSGSSNQVAHAIAFFTSGQADSAISSSVSWSGSANEGGAGIVTFTDGGGGAPDVLGRHTIDGGMNPVQGGMQ